MNTSKAQGGYENFRVHMITEAGEKIARVVNASTPNAAGLIAKAKEEQAGWAISKILKVKVVR